MATKIAPPPAPVIVIRRVKKVVAAGHHGGAWKVAYADFVTAMMAFFMLLWLLANPDQVRLKGLAEYFSPSSASSKPGETIETEPGSNAALGGQRQRAQTSDPDTKGTPASKADQSKADRSKAEQSKAPDASLRVMAEELKLLLQPTSIPRAEREVLQMERSRDGLRVSLMDDGKRSMFRGGTAILNPYARELLGQVARKLAQSRLNLAIEGHTDGTGGQSESNWKLSADRALAARSALIAAGLTPDRFTEVVALGATQLVYPDQPGRAENRRITIVLMAETGSLPSDVSFRF